MQHRIEIPDVRANEVQQAHLLGLLRCAVRAGDLPQARDIEALLHSMTPHGYRLRIRTRQEPSCGVSDTVDELVPAWQ
jgi:hypothetical protein